MDTNISSMRLFMVRILKRAPVSVGIIGVSSPSMLAVPNFFYLSWQYMMWVVRFLYSTINHIEI